MTDENRGSNAREEIRVATDALRAAEALLDLGLLRDAVSRAYYAAFHAARALLLWRGHQVKTHGGLARLFHEHVVAPGDLPSRFDGVLMRLMGLRGASDYALAFTMSADDVRAELRGARDLVEAAAALLPT
jgi:uncharacterized protein (UPF0332 family)